MNNQGLNPEPVAKFIRSIKKLSESQFQNDDIRINKIIKADELIALLKISTMQNRKSIAGCAMFLFL